jgi:hypothetical protein
MENSMAIIKQADSLNKLRSKTNKKDILKLFKSI